VSCDAVKAAGTQFVSPSFKVFPHEQAECVSGLDPVLSALDRRVAMQVNLACKSAASSRALAGDNAG
jgi:hypothetical protein